MEWWTARGSRPWPAFDARPAEGQYTGFHMLSPQYGDSADDIEMAKISRLYAAFAFRKVRKDLAICSSRLDILSVSSALNLPCGF
jgi:hypothetical protein